MSSTPLGPAQPAPQPQPSVAVGLSTAHMPSFPNSGPDTLDARVRDLEQKVNFQASWQGLYLNSQNELAACKSKNEELQKRIDLLARELNAYKKSVHKDFSIVSHHMNNTAYRFSQIEDRFSKAHHQLDERLTHTVQQQAAQADSFQDHYVAPLFSALHKLLPSGIGATSSDETSQTDDLQPSISKTSVSVTEQDASANAGDLLSPSIVRQVDPTLPPTQVPGIAADQDMAPLADQMPIEATAERSQTSMSTIGLASIPHPRNDAARVELSSEPPSSLPTRTQVASDSVAMSNAATSSDIKASSSHETQQLATPQTVEVPSAIAAPPESSPQTKRKRTPSVEHVSTKIARRSAQSFIKSAGVAPESSGSMPSFKTAQATLPPPPSTSSATPHTAIPHSNVAAVVESDAIQRSERPSSTLEDLGASQQHFSGHSTVPTELQEGSTMAQPGLELSDSPAVRNSLTVANTVGAAKPSTQASMVPNVGNSSAQVPSKGRLSPREAQRRVKELTAPRSASRVGNTARPDQVAKSGAPSLPERPSTAESNIARGAPSTLLLASNGSRNSAPAQTPAMYASPPPPRPGTSAGGTSRRPSSLEEHQAGMAAAYSRLDTSDAIIAHRMSSRDVEINDGRATSKGSLPPNWTGHRSQSHVSPPTSPDVPLSSLASSADASWPSQSSPGPQASAAAVPPEPSPSDEAAPTTRIAIARQSKEPDVHPAGLAASSSNSASGVVNPTTEGSRPPSTANRSVLTADPRRKALLPSLSANSSGLSTSAQAVAPIKPVVSLKHALPSKPLVSTNQSTQTRTDTSTSVHALTAQTDPPVQSVKLEQGAVVPSSAQQTERPQLSLPRSSTSKSDLGRDNVDIQSREEGDVHPSSFADTSTTPRCPPPRPASVNGRDGVSSGPKPASQATQEPSQASSAPLDKDLTPAQVEARPVLETPSSAESRQRPARAAVEKQQTVHLQPHRSVAVPPGRQAMSVPARSTPDCQYLSGSACDSREDERFSDQGRSVGHDVGTGRQEIMSRQAQSRVERLASIDKACPGRQVRDSFYIMAFAGGSDILTALVITQNSQITDSLISEDLANDLLQAKGARRLEPDESESWLEINLSWRYDTNKHHSRAGGNKDWFRGRQCHFLIVPREHMEAGICLGRKELDRLNLSIATGFHGRPFLSAGGANEPGIKLFAFPAYEYEQHLSSPLKRLCSLAKAAVNRSPNSWRATERTGRRDNMDQQGPSSAHGEVSRSNASRLEPRGHNTLSQESSIEAESSLERDHILRGIGERRDREHDAPHLTTPLANATPLRVPTTQDGSIDRNSSGVIAEGRDTPSLDTGSPLTPLSQASEEEEEEEEDELVDETDSEHRSAPETLQDLTEDERRAVIERTQRLLQDQKGAREQAGHHGNAPPTGLRLMGSSQRFKNLGDATQ